MFTGSEQGIPIMETDGRWKAQVPIAPNCPRCASTNTKFCYYNNYSLAQPRYFCKGCRRYWTKGGSLRNVPVGGGCRKSRRSRSRAHTSNRNSDKEQPNQTSTEDFGSEKNSGPEIDLAAVFARYVNQDSVVPSQSVSEGVNDQEFQQTDQQNQQLVMNDQGIAECNDLESFDYDILLTDDVFWSTSEDGSISNAWEPMAQLEDLDSSPVEFMPVLDEQFSSPEANLLVSDTNWSCFDLAGYGDFYRP